MFADERWRHFRFFVMPAPVAGIHDLFFAANSVVDGRDKPGHDEEIIGALGVLTRAKV
jgi:hypothetical protein